MRRLFVRLPMIFLSLLTSMITTSSGGATKRLMTVAAQLSGQYWLQAAALYVAACIPALLGPLTFSAIGVVTDPAGTAWQGADIHLGVA